ncbi:Thymidylate kinase [Seinonella peptonophila]|uniref:Thymidylate kinase n=1 Tax=Seinonella peptonophila TaxID=112248 RepID=A0A1M4ZXP0_9BACL|nr:deoxynucleoside kinase [Seinonella peptonophila]SHF22768.1 Thymidylate kinase [Seinonella peptonophila]
MGKLIVLEGICGSGKTTLSNKLISELTKRDVPCIYNHGAFTYSKIGRSFKEIASDYPIAKRTIYYISDLLQDYYNVIKPHLANDYVIIQDRYIDSIWVYNECIGMIDGQDYAVMEIFDHFQSFGLLPQPDSVIFCYCETKEIIKRLTSKPDSNIHSMYLNQPEFIGMMQTKYTEALSKRQGLIKIDTSEHYNVTSLVDRILL